MSGHDMPALSSHFPVADPDALDLLRRLLTFDYRKRITLDVRSAAGAAGRGKRQREGRRGERVKGEKRGKRRGVGRLSVHLPCHPHLQP